MQAVAKRKQKGKRALFLLIVGALVLILGIARWSPCRGKALRFDTAYDQQGDLSAFFFDKLEEGQSYSTPQRIWLLIARQRLPIMLVGLALIVIYVALNRELLYDTKIAPYVFIAPFLITFLIFFTYPLINTVLMSFQKVTSAGNEWNDLENYKNLLGNKNFHTAVRNSLVYMVISCAILIPIPMLLAYMTESKLTKMGGVFKSIAYVPVLCFVVVAGIIFRMMFSELDGAMMNEVRGLFGLEPIAWLKTASGSMFAMVLLCFWRWTGMNMLYYMAGLWAIPSNLYEAADLDGCNNWQKFTKISLPLLKPTTIYVLTISIYAGLSMFTESYMIFGGNNSPKNYGLTIVGYLYRYGFEQVDRFGFASAVGLVLLVGAMIITVIQLRITGVIGK